MIFYAINPAPQLREFVRVLRIIHFEFATSEGISAKPYPPRPENTISFYPYQSEVVTYEGKKSIIKNVRSALVGQHNIVSTRQVSQDFLVIQVVLQPGALFRITKIPASELVNCYENAETFFGKSLRDVNDRLAEMTDVNAMVQLIELFLSKLLSARKIASLPIDKVLPFMILDDRRTVEYLAEASCLSLKQFERKFAERVGMPPKYFRRIVRFEKAFRLKNLDAEKDWLSIALDANYYDYQHLVRDYKEFTGKTPVNFHQLDQHAPERKFNLRDTF